MCQPQAPVWDQIFKNIFTGSLVTFYHFFKCFMFTFKKTARELKTNLLSVLSFLERFLGTYFIAYPLINCSKKITLTCGLFFCIIMWVNDVGVLIGFGYLCCYYEPLWPVSRAHLSSGGSQQMLIQGTWVTSQSHWLPLLMSTRQILLY